MQARTNVSSTAEIFELSVDFGQEHEHCQVDCQFDYFYHLTSLKYTNFCTLFLSVSA